MNVSTATTKELVAFYNANAETPVKRFSDRATAERRVSRLLEEMAQASGEECKHTYCSINSALEVVCDVCGEVQEPAEAEQMEKKEADAEAPAATEAPTDKVRSEAISESWKDPEVKAKRSARHFVRVDGVEYRSVRAAFVALSLPLNQHIKFRMALKAAGKLESYGKSWEAFEA